MTAAEDFSDRVRRLLSEGALPLMIAGTFFMQLLDASVITPAIPAMAQSFGVRPVEMNLGVSIYMMTVAVFIPASGWAAQRFGARRVFLLAIVTFVLASFLCGLCQNLPQFLAARMLQGLGGAMMVPVGRLLVLQVTPKEKLMTVMATLTWPGLIAPVLGPPVGGLVVDSASWRWIFWLNLPLGAIAIYFALRLLPRLERDRSLRFDWLGFGLIGPALFCLLFAAEALGGQQVAWLQEALLAAAGVILLTLGFRHLRRSDKPLLRFDAMRFKTFRLSVIGGSFFRIGVNATPFLLPLYFQIAFGWSALSAGLMLTAVFAGNIAMKPFTTPLLRGWGFRTVLLSNVVLNGILVMAMALMGPETPKLAIAALLFASGMMRSLQFTAMNTLAYADIPREEMSHANSLNSTVMQLARGSGVAVAAIFWRLGEVIYGGDGLAGFRFAFVVLGALSLFMLLDCIGLSRDAGAVVSGRRVRSSAS